MSELARVKCRVCKQLKLRKEIGIKITARSCRGIDVDENGAFWNGLVCPECFKKYKRSAEDRRRARIKKANEKAKVNYVSKPKESAKCKFCNKFFLKSMKTATYCSLECRKQSSSYRNYPRKEHAAKGCKVCGNSFKPRNFNQKCCSKDCRKKLLLKYASTYRKARYKPKPKKPCKAKVRLYTKEQSCIVCNSIFLSKSSRNHCCSLGCWRLTPLGKASLKRAKIGIKKRPKTEKHKTTHKYHKKLRKRKLKERIPNWTSRKDIEDFYAKCPEDCYVDHVIPINNPLVSGLHCPDNFQYLPKLENSFKSNKFDGTYENEAWRAEFKNKEIE